MRRMMLLALVGWLGFASAARAGDPLLPDLTVSAGNFELDLDTNVDLGDVAENCASATHGIDLLRFDATTYNALGAADLEIGDPLCPDCDTSPGETCGNPDFHCSPAGGHGHAHFTNYARYELFEPGGLEPVRVGGKFGFCLEDTSCDDGISPVYDCSFQGLTAGCEDLYSRFLGCQYIDVTGLATGDYVVRVTADPEDKIAELDDTNNVSEYPFYIEGTAELAEPLPGSSLELKAKRDGTRLRLLAKAAAELTLPSPPIAPTVGGATLSLDDSASGADPETFELPAAGWKGLGRPPGAKGYRYRGAKGSACRKAKLTSERLTATCTGTLALPAAGELTLVLTSGEASEGKLYCTRFGGTEKRNDARKLKRVDAAPPDACPPAP
jgi:Lysyl oxidase